MDVEFVKAPPGRDMTLAGLSWSVPALAAGAAEFGVTTVPYVLAVQAEAGGRLPVRFILVNHQRHPMAGVVADASPLRHAADLAGRATAAHGLPWFVAEYAHGLAATGLGGARFVPTTGGDYGAAALASGAAEVLPTWADTLPVVRRTTGFPVRAVPLGLDAYATGVIAADRVPAGVVSRMRDALAAAMELQRRQPEVGALAYLERFPHIPKGDIDLSWSSFVEHGWGEGPAGAMDEAAWQRTVAFTAAAHGLPTLSPEQLYRPELLAGAPIGASAGPATPSP